jgi:hypothetical protein
MHTTALFLLWLATAAPKSDFTPVRETRVSVAPAHTGICGAVSRIEAELELGRRFEPGVEETEGAETSCNFAAGAEGEAVVRVSVQKLAAQADPAAEVAGLKQAFPDATVCEVPGIGEKAVLLHLPGAGAQMHVLLPGGRYLMVSVLGFGDGKNASAAAESLARKAAGRV